MQNNTGGPGDGNGDILLEEPRGLDPAEDYTNAQKHREQRLYGGPHSSLEFFGK